MKKLTLLYFRTSCHLYGTHMSFICHSYVLSCHSCVLVCHPYVTCMSSICHSYVTCMYLYVIRMSLVCTCMSSVCHSYVLVCHSYVTCLWFYHEPIFKIQGNCKYFKQHGDSNCEDCYIFGPIFTNKKFYKTYI